MESGLAFSRRGASSDRHWRGTARRGRAPIRQIVQFETRVAGCGKSRDRTHCRNDRGYSEAPADLAVKQAGKIKGTESFRPARQRRAEVRADWQLARTRVKLSQLVRSIEFIPLEKRAAHHSLDLAHGTRTGCGPKETRAGGIRPDSQRPATRWRCRNEAHASAHSQRRSGSRTGQEGTDRGEPAPGGVHRQALHEPRAAIPRSDSGRQHRPDASRGEIRVAARIQILDVCDLVDSPVG